MRFFAEAFEGEGGRSITGQASALVSALPYVVGYKSDGDLRYINASTPRAVDLLAVDPQLKKIPLENVTLNVIAQEYVSVVTKKENGSYGYESVLKERVGENREDRDQRGWIALSVADRGAGRLRGRVAGRRRPPESAASAFPSWAAASSNARSTKTPSCR